MNKVILLLSTVAFMTLTQQAFAELKPIGTVQEYACAENQSKESSIAKICFSRVVGEEGQFITTADRKGESQLWRITQSDMVYIDINNQKKESYQVQYIGTVVNSLLQETIHTTVLAGEILKVSNADSQALSVTGEIYGNQITANQFEVYLFTLGNAIQGI